MKQRQHGIVTVEKLGKLDWSILFMFPSRDRKSVEQLTYVFLMKEIGDPVVNSNESMLEYVVLQKFYQRH